MRSLLLVIVLTPAFLKAATVETVSSGDWETGSTWSTGNVPACGDVIIIRPGHVIFVTSNNSTLSGCASATYIQLFGTLDFGNGDKLHLPCGSGIAIESGGAISSAGSGGGSSNQLTVCGNTVWSKADGNVSGPSSLGTNILPIELVAFEAILGGNKVKISWSTASEVNNAYFDLQRSSDGVNWKSVLIVAGVGNSSSLKTYSVEDELHEKGTYIYKLIQYDFNKYHETFGPLQITYSGLSDIRPYPNPTTGILNLGNLNSDDTYSITVANTNGVAVRQFELINGMAQLDLSELPTGIYVVSISGRNETTAHRIMVQ